MIEKTVYDHFKEAGYNVYFEHPEETPEGVYLVIEKTGETLENTLWTAVFAVQVYAPTLAEAASESGFLTRAINDLYERRGVQSSHVLGRYNFTDTETKEYRYQVIMDVVYIDI